VTPEKMMSQYPTKVGEVRPSQLLFTYGVGAIIDLPRLSVIVTGLEDWPSAPQYVQTIVEDRLLTAVRYQLPAVKKLLAPPLIANSGLPPDPFDSAAKIGVPVATFPRWMVCPFCRLLAPLKSGLFKLKEQVYRPNETGYIHENCNKGKKPDVVPARFLVACESGHLDDFPWIYFVHKGNSCDSPLLRLLEYGPSGEARDLEVRCDSCEDKRRMSEAFGKQNREQMPLCRGRRPHLRDIDPDGCEHKMRTLTLGASNTWFPVVYSTVAIPVDSGRLPQLVDDHWATLQNVTAPVIVGFLRSNGQLGALAEFSDDDIWQAVETRRRQDAGEIPPPTDTPDLKAPEWQVFTQYNPRLNGDDFRLRPVAPPSKFSDYFDQVVLVERLREVRAMVGFTRLDAAGELTDPDMSVYVEPAPLVRREAAWVPAAEVRGEGIFIQFDEARIQSWSRETAVIRRGDEFVEAHRKWRAARNIVDPDKGFPGIRYILIHSFAHALMRQLALECGYSAASIRERIYARPPEREDGPMAGLLIYTSAPDSEGTLGGLVSLGQPEVLARHIGQALEAMRLCASDPLCAEHPPSRTGRALHAAACHACQFSPETSCERGNKYLDRSLLVPTVEQSDLAFFKDVM
jgi:hypothetical protein